MLGILLNQKLLLFISSIVLVTYHLNVPTLEDLPHMIFNVLISPREFVFLNKYVVFDYVANLIIIKSYFLKFFS